jgi:hypothetical protein
MTNAEIKKTLKRILEVRADESNYGMFSKKRILAQDERFRMRNLVRFQDDEVITFNGVPKYRAMRNFSEHKRNGMYKELAPKIVEYKDED